MQLPLCRADEKFHGSVVPLPGNKIPVHSDNSLVLESLERFWKYQMTCAFALFETDNPKLSSTVTFLDRHQAIVFDL
jgi:hypothetical protein